MGDKEPNVHALMEGFSKRLKVAERELTNVEKSAKTLNEKDAAIREEREVLERQIAECEEFVAPLLEEREQLREKYTLAAFEGRAGEQEDIHKRREELDETVAEHRKHADKLRASLDSLDDTSEAAARLKFRLEQINYGSASVFVMELKKVLDRHVSGLGTRKQQAELSLPSFDPATLEAVREEEIDGYLEQKQAKAESAERAEQAREEREQKDAERRALVRRINDVSAEVDDKGERLPRLGSRDYETYARTGVNPLPALKEEYEALVGK